jgi:hypothetical protein
MENGQSGRQRPDQIDLPILWAFARGAQALVTVIYAKFAFISFGTKSFAEDVSSVIGMLLVMYLFLHRLVTGTADSTGVHYRRYFRLQSVPWGDVQEIQWVGFQLRILIKGRRMQKKKLIFLLNPLKALGPYWAHRLGTEVAPPEILQRISALPIETPPQIGSAPPYSKWILWTFLGFFILFVLVLIWRLISASVGANHLSY